MARVPAADPQLGLLEDGLQAGEIGSSEDEAVLGRDVDEVEVDARSCHLASQVGEHARPVFDLDDDHLSLAADSELRERQGVPGGFGVRHQDVQLDIVGGAETRRRRKVDTGVADRSGDARESAGLVLDLDDQVERNRTPSTSLTAMGRAGIEPATLGLRVPCSTS
jgi:hypothetical protein